MAKVYSMEDRELCLALIAHDIGVHGATKTFKTIELLLNPQDRMKVRKLYYDVVKMLDAYGDVPRANI